MIGWILLFALLSLLGLTFVAMGAATVVSMTAASLLFAFLSLLCVLTLFVRKQV